MNNITQAMESIYESINNENEEIDARIITLKIALYAQGAKSVEVDPSRLAQPNREGRKLLQSYFKKRGVSVIFSSSC